jgi:hypothetical protein
MKSILMVFVMAFIATQARAQKDFTGILKYHMTVEGDSIQRTDSMKLIVGKSKIKVVLYIPSQNDPGKATEQVFIDDLVKETTTVIDYQKSGYTVSARKKEPLYTFSNTNQYDAVNRKLCLRYETDRKTSLSADVVKASCLAGIDFLKPDIPFYYFLGVQPLIIDNRMVLDYTLTLRNGHKQKTVCYEVQAFEEVDVLFSLEGLKPL